MNEILCNFGELRTFEGMTGTTILIYNILKFWLSSVPVNNWQKSRLDVLKKCVIYVTSQDRGNGSHVNGNAVDISVWSNDSLTGELSPSPLILIIAGELSQYNLFCAVSTYNYHIHIERSKQGFMAENLYLSGVRVPPKLYTDSMINERIAVRRFEPLAPELFNILILYHAFPSNLVTNYVLAYIHRTKEDYDKYYKKIFPDGSTYVWELTSMSPKETETFIHKISSYIGISDLTFKIAAGLIIGVIIWKNV